MNRKKYTKPLLHNPDKPEPKKIGFIFTTKITKKKKNKIYNLRALRVLRGVIKLFLPQNAQNLQLMNQSRQKVEPVGPYARWPVIESINHENTKRTTKEIKFRAQ
ncbi:MAG: hypothetical protein U9N83_09535 [Thermodesulfobacteriota bacterium]|nr:hypothetical protein [Thermodesulfobacteriota bacterium]